MADSEPFRPRQGPGRTLVLILVAGIAGYVFAGHGFRWLWRDSAGVRHNFETMRTYARITIPDGEGESISPADIARLAEQAVQEVNALMGPVGEYSDIRTLNSAGKNRWVEVHPRTWAVVMEALRWHRLTNGAFDPTIGPLKRLFTFSGGEEPWPDETTLEQARAKVGADKIRFNREGLQLSTTVDGMVIDLGAIAKGYAADRAADVLLANGVRNALVDIGGELRVLGMKPGNPPTPWRAGIRNPRKDEVLEELPLTNVAVATSGDYENFFFHNGQRYEHIIDPRSGTPLAEGVASVTVIHPDSCLAADALATSLSVLGVEEGEKFLRSQALGLFSTGVQVIILTIDGKDRLVRTEFNVDDKGDVETSSEVIS